MEKEVVQKRGKNRIRQLRKRKTVWHKITRVAIHLFAWVGFAILYYFGISLLFYTPYEYTLKVTNDSMQQEYETLHGALPGITLLRCQPTRHYLCSRERERERERESVCVCGGDMYCSCTLVRTLMCLH